MDDEATSAIQELIYETVIISTSIMNVCNMLDRLGFEFHVSRSFRSGTVVICIFTYLG